VLLPRTTLLLGLGALACALGAAACQSNGVNQPPPPDGGGNAGGTGGSTVAPQPVKILDWNVHNFEDDENDGFQNEWVETTADWDAHRQVVGSVLAALNPDIAILQEVEGMDVLEALNNQELAGRYTVLKVALGNDPRGLDLAMLSRIPVDEIVDHKADSFTEAGQAAPFYSYARNCLEAHFTINGRKVVLFGVHYKAKESDDPHKRLAEAQHTRSLADAVTTADPEAATLILGDFNDTPGSPPLDWTVGTTQSAPDKYADAADSVTAADRWTMIYQGNNELVDHQMSNPLFTSMLNTGSVQILHSSDAQTASDHAPVMATYDVH